MFPTPLFESIVNGTMTLSDQWMTNCDKVMCKSAHLYHGECNDAWWEKTSPLELAIHVNNVSLVKRMLHMFTEETFMALKMYAEVEVYIEDLDCYEIDCFPSNPLLFAEFYHTKDSDMYRAISVHFKWQKVRDVVRARPYVLHWLQVRAMHFKWHTLMAYGSDGGLLYAGECKDGKRHGKGKSYYPGGQFNYDGEWQYDKQHGQGKHYYRDGTLKYEGEWQYDKRHGQGKQYFKDGTLEYEGEWQNNERHGQGKQYYPDGTTLKYDGQFQGEKRHGQGKRYFEDGTLAYEGEWQYDKRHGQGKRYFEDGTLAYEGEWQYDKRHGQGKQYYPDGPLNYEGEWQNNERHGQGKQYFEDGLSYYLKYDGQFQGEQRHGQGKQYFNDGTLEYEGEWQRDDRHGQGREFGAHRKLLRNGEWKEGNLWNGRKLSDGRTVEHYVIDGDHVTKERKRALDKETSRVKKFRKLCEAEPRMPKCAVCYDILHFDVGVYTYMPCGHRVVCEDCATSPSFSSRTMCIVCKEEAVFFKKTFSA
jgi:antitoxin component YwqK of YwqJK toxin-antitoxin module